MTLHPTRLHARAWLWSLDTALLHLDRAAAAEDRANAADDGGTLQAWRPGTGIRVAGHHDLLDAIIYWPSNGNAYADRARRTADTVRWVAKTALADRYRRGVDDLTQLREALPTFGLGTTVNLARWIEEQDLAVRHLIGERNDHQLIPVVACPSCDRAGVLALRMSGPAEERVIVCTVGCPCAGDGCACGMSVKAEHVAHVWTMAQFRAAASPDGTMPAQPRQSAP